MNVPGYAPGLYAPGHAQGLGPAAEPSRGASMLTAAGRANWGARFTLNCAGLAATRPLASGPWTCPTTPRRLHAARRQAATERRRLRASAARRMRSDACAPLRACHIRAAARRLRPPRLGGSAAPAQAAAARCGAQRRRRRLGPRACAALDQGAWGVECEGGKSDGNVYWLHTLRGRGSRWVQCLQRLLPLFYLLPPVSAAIPEVLEMTWKSS
jgi:hypothetical protein